MPQDFQDALSIIFDRKPEDEIGALVDPPSEPPPIPTPSIIAEPLSAEEVLQHQQQAAALQKILDEQSQQSMDLYSAFAVVNGVAMLKTDHLAGFNNTNEDVNLSAPLLNSVGQVPLPPTPNDDDSVANITEKAEDESSDSRDAELKAARQAELDDLAMLGIDADDLAAQCM